MKTAASFASALNEAAPYSATERERAIERLRVLADLLDTAILVPGTRFRFGLDGVLGLVPVVGDIVTSALALYIVYEARRLGVPRFKIARMLGNVALDGCLGAVPVAGDLFDFAFKANRRNMRILQAHLDGEKRRY